MYMAKSFFLFLSFFLLLNLYSNAQVKVTHLLCNDRDKPVGLGDPRPRLTWRLEGSGYDIHQSAYEVCVHGPHTRWSSGKVQSSQSVHVPYKGEPLVSCQHYSWQVRVWDGTGKSSVL